MVVTRVSRLASCLLHSEPSLLVGIDRAVAFIVFSLGASPFSSAFSREGVPNGRVAILIGTIVKDKKEELCVRLLTS